MHAENGSVGVNKIADKIRRLLALATSSNPHEAALAAQRAQELILKYNVDQAEIEAAGRAKDGYSAEPVGQEVGWTFGRTFPIWYLNLSSAMAKPFLCQVYWTSGVGQIWVVGRKSNREAFKATWDFVRGQITQLADAGWKALEPYQRTATHVRSWKTGFCNGAVATINLRLLESEKALGSSTATAIVVRDRNQEVALWVRDNLRLRNSGLRSSARDGFSEGQKAGWSVDVGRRATKQLGGGK